MLSCSSGVSRRGKGDGVQRSARPGRRVGGPWARPLVHDPLFSDDELRAIGFEPVAADVALIGSIVQAEHEAYRDLGSLDIGVGVVVIDGRNWVRGSGRDPTGHHRTR